MTISLRSSTSVASATRTNTTVTAPTGAVSGSDIIVVAIDAGGSSSRTISTPSGWTLAGSVAYSNTDPWTVNLYLFVRVHDGASSWTFNHSSAVSDAWCGAYSGVDTTTPSDVTAATSFVTGNPGQASNTATLNSITIATAGAQEIAVRGSWDGNAITPPAGWTERLDQFALWIGEKAAAGTGATGTTSIPAGNSPTYPGGTYGPYATIHAALRPASSGTDGTLAGAKAQGSAQATSGTFAAGSTLAGSKAQGSAQAASGSLSGGATLAGSLAEGSASARFGSFTAASAITGSAALGSAQAEAGAFTASSTLQGSAAQGSTAAQSGTLSASGNGSISGSPAQGSTQARTGAFTTGAQLVGSTAQGSTTARDGSLSAINGAILAGTTAFGTAMGRDGTFTASSVLTGSPAQGTAQPRSGLLSISQDGTLTGSTARGSSSARPGQLTGTAVMVGSAAVGSTQALTGALLVPDAVMAGSTAQGSAQAGSGALLALSGTHHTLTGRFAASPLVGAFGPQRLTGRFDA